MRSKLIEIAKKILIAIIAVVIAALIRKYLLANLEEKVVWITFYPAVMIAAILGGFFSGILSSVFTIIIVVFGWNFFIDNPFISDNVGVLSVAVFFINCSLISGISEYSRQQRIKANIQKEKAENASKAKSTFLANISHELRTPLNAILGFAKLMQDNPKIPDNEHENLNIIIRSGSHLLGLINDILDIAKIEAGKTTLSEMSFNFENTIFEVVELMNQQAAAKKLLLKADIAENLPKYIKTDKQKFKQILINIVGNAIKYTQTGYVKIKIKHEKNNITIKIEDTGIGISKDELSKIFAPFIQSSSNTLQKGTGLGLTISKQFIELMGGEISVKSELGKGSVFTILLPLKEGDETDFMQKQNVFTQVSSIVSGQDVFRILIVEDQKENWMLMKQLHEKVGIPVRIAENGQEGVEIFKEWRPHLIWMDIRMPVKDGIEATKEIRKLKTGTDVIIIGVSAHVFKDEIKNTIDVGMNAFVKKPFKLHEIYQHLNELLGIRFNFKEFAKSTNKMSLTADMFNKVDKELVNELKEAIESLNEEAIDSCISKIAGHDAKLSNILRDYTSSLKFTFIYNILSEIKK